ncbi:hypothetical protein LK13_14390 [Paenibacillus polymyxa]|nr:hypothetical protein LK13_14390 [Paenibacillus polymyxa]RPE11229.1 hypothetical protein EG487_01355 [Paenibacillus polymyxa]
MVIQQKMLIDMNERDLEKEFELMMHFDLAEPNSGHLPCLYEGERAREIHYLQGAMAKRNYFQNSRYVLE